MIGYNKIIGMMYNDQLSFVSSWNTANTSAGSSTSAQVKLPLVSTGTYNFSINWGDGNSDTITAWNDAAVTHTYASSGTYIITITGTCTGFYFNNTGDRLKILSISSWGTFKLGTNQGLYFYGCSNLDLSSVTDVLDLTGTTNLNSAFFGYSKATIARINEWNVSAVTNMASTFQNNTLFNSNISSWNTASVTTMSAMFASASAFNQNIGGWNVSNVTNMLSMFQSASAFNQNIGGWNVSNVTSFGSMFRSASAFNQNISSWSIKTTGTINFSGFFQSASNFNQNIGGWNTSAVTNMNAMFQSASAFNQNIGGWNVSNVSDFGNMFLSASAFNNGGSSTINNWSLKTTGTVFIYTMFQSAINFNQPIGNWNVSAVTIMSSVFQSATSFNQDLSSWNVSAVTSMLAMFASASAFNQNIGGWNVSNVTNMLSMFQSASAFNQNIGGWNVSNVSDFGSFMTGKTAANFSTTNLDAIYNGWSALAGGVKPNLTITFGTAKYTAASSAGRAILTGSPNNWSITDGGI